MVQRREVFLRKQSFWTILNAWVCSKFNWIFDFAKQDFNHRSTNQFNFLRFRAWVSWQEHFLCKNQSGSSLLVYTCCIEFFLFLHATKLAEVEFPLSSCSIEQTTAVKNVNSLLMPTAMKDNRAAFFQAHPFALQYSSVCRQHNFKHTRKNALWQGCYNMVYLSLSPNNSYFVLGSNTFKI